MALDRIIPVASVSDFLSRVEQEKKAEEERGNKADFIFRGQRTDEPLLPRLARVAPKGQFANIERLMSKEFERTSLALTDRGLASKLDFLSVAQHHGLPTRLLDWTSSALAGLWFAVEKPPQEEGRTLRDAVVWLLKTRVTDFIDEDTRACQRRYKNLSAESHHASDRRARRAVHHSQGLERGEPYRVGEEQAFQGALAKVRNPSNSIRRSQVAFERLRCQPFLVVSRPRWAVCPPFLALHGEPLLTVNSLGREGRRCAAISEGKAPSLVLLPRAHSQCGDVLQNLLERAADSHRLQARSHPASIFVSEIKSLRRSIIWRRHSG